ncbi:MAG: ATP-dependent DNA ligase [Dehalococcoidia bacterium]
MSYERFVAVLRQIEATSGRRQTVALLADALAALPGEEVPQAVLLVQGLLSPPFEGIELGMAEAEAARALALAAGLPAEEVRSELHRRGDLGELATLLPAGRGGLALGEVFDALLAIARDRDPGSQGRKRAALASLLGRASPDEVRYLLRTATGKLRLGVGDATLLEAIATAFLAPDARPLVERAYRLTSDLGAVAGLARRGAEALGEVRIQPGKPVRMMLAERLPTPAAIVEQLGPHTAEYKYDGERLQIHWDGAAFRAFSRRIEDVTHQIPDLLDALAELNRPFILEAEAVVVDPTSGAMRPFQHVLNRRVKRLTPEILASYPLKAFVFDLLHHNGDDLIDLPYRARRARLEAIVPVGERLALSTARPIANRAQLEVFFDEAIGAGTEGVMCKAPASPYEAGRRGFAWIKYKGPGGGALTDTLDLVVVGAWWGRGRRAGAYGSLLVATFNPDDDCFETISRLGAGLTDRHLFDLLPALLNPLRRDSPPARLESRLRPDVWFDPAIVFEVQAQELTRSPMHTCGVRTLGDGRGLALRFPRFVRHRDDKRPAEATTTAEVLELFETAQRLVPRG